VASVLRMTGDLTVAQDAVQEACLAALAQWPDRGWPDQPRAWLTGVARHKAVDLIRREAARTRKEAAAMRDLAAAGEPGPGELAGPGGDELGLVFMCCHPALALEARVALTLRCVCGRLPGRAGTGADRPGTGLHRPPDRRAPCGPVKGPAYPEPHGDQQRGGQHRRPAVRCS